MTRHAPLLFLLPLSLAALIVIPYRQGHSLASAKLASARMANPKSQPQNRVTQTLGAFITPVTATASSSQNGAGRTPAKLIDGSGWGESKPGSGVYMHTNNVGADGSCMWNGAPDAWLLFDLGKEYRTSGVYVWNYNEAGGWNTRGVKDVEISASSDNKTFVPVGTFTLALAPGTENYAGEAVRFPAPIRARWFRWQIKSNYRSGEQSGLSEVRFANANVKAVIAKPVAWKPTYARPAHPKLALGQPLGIPGAENIVYPADAGIVDVSKAPYNAKGDGKTDDTRAIQKALDDYPQRNAIIYLPNGNYLVSNTLRWGGKDDEQRNTVLQGQSRAGTTLTLRDNCPGFDDPRHPRGVIYTGHAPAQRFSNEVHNLTIDTGAGNPGACGAQFIANNQGGIWNVTLISGDGQGVVGLDMGYTDEQGPCLIKNVRVVGFDVGIRVATSVDSETLEHITLEHQNKFGFRNDGQPCTIRDLSSLNQVPALRAGSGFTVLVDSVLTGTGGAATQPAVIADAPMFVRDLQTKGYGMAIQNKVGHTTIAGPNIPLFLTKPGASLFGPPQTSNRRLARETPSLAWDALKDWAAPQRFGAKTDDTKDAADAIQQAIDSGAATVYLPRGNYHIGKTIVLRGKVRRIIGCRAFLTVEAPLTGQNKPLFRFENGASPVVAIEGISTDFSSGPYFFMEHAAKRTLVMKRLAINFQGADAYRTGEGGTGDVYFEDIVGRFFHLKNQHLWARQFNPEGDGVHLENDGGVAWILGMKTEGGGPLLDLKNGSVTELLGSFSYTVGDSKRAPMFVIHKSFASLSFAEVCYSGAPMPIIVRETQEGVTKELVTREIKQDDPRWRGHFTLYTANPTFPNSGRAF